jgi:hypothetical protein
MTYSIADCSLKLPFKVYFPQKEIGFNILNIKKTPLQVYEMERETGLEPATLTLAT